MHPQSSERVDRELVHGQIPLQSLCVSTWKLSARNIRNDLLEPCPVSLDEFSYSAYFTNLSAPFLPCAFCRSMFETVVAASCS